ncbi:hypothetical protein F5Y18DRAFT_444569 [Xylariaceae sp. FL1019]|nr:hypothetical protein F5Y18DRAFT_444569 [Xylariaceae sp. FL1019]
MTITFSLLAHNGILASLGAWNSTMLRDLIRSSEQSARQNIQSGAPSSSALTAWVSKFKRTQTEQRIPPRETEQGITPRETEQGITPRETEQRIPSRETEQQIPPREDVPPTLQLISSSPLSLRTATAELKSPSARLLEVERKLSRLERLKTMTTATSLKLKADYTIRATPEDQSKYKRLMEFLEAESRQLFGGQQFPDFTLNLVTIKDQSDRFCNGETFLCVRGLSSNDEITRFHAVISQKTVRIYYSPLRLCYDRSEVEHASTQDSRQYHVKAEHNRLTLCGATLRTEQAGVSWTATVGGLIEIDNRCYMLTASDHGLSRPQPPAEENLSSIATLGDNDFDDDVTSALVLQDEEKAVMESEALAVEKPLSSATESIPEVPDVDWQLVQVHEKGWLPNQIPAQKPQPNSLQLSSDERQLWSGYITEYQPLLNASPALIITGHSGLVPGFVIAVPSYLMSKNKVREVWAIQLDAGFNLRKGDSGSWVIDSSRRVLGSITAVSNGYAYMTPFLQTLEEITKALKPRNPICLPQPFGQLLRLANLHSVPDIEAGTNYAEKAMSTQVPYSHSDYLAATLRAVWDTSDPKTKKQILQIICRHAPTLESRLEGCGVCYPDSVKYLSDADKYILHILHDKYTYVKEVHARANSNQSGEAPGSASESLWESVRRFRNLVATTWPLSWFPTAKPVLKAVAMIPIVPLLPLWLMILAVSSMYRDKGSGLHSIVARSARSIVDVMVMRHGRLHSSAYLWKHRLFALVAVWSVGIIASIAASHYVFHAIDPANDQAVEFVRETETAMPVTIASALQCGLLIYITSTGAYTTIILALNLFTTASERLIHHYMSCSSNRNRRNRVLSLLRTLLSLTDTFIMVPVMVGWYESFVILQAKYLTVGAAVVWTQSRATFAIGSAFAIDIFAVKLVFHLALNIMSRPENKQSARAFMLNHPQEAQFTPPHKSFGVLLFSIESLILVAVRCGSYALAGYIYARATEAGPIQEATYAVAGLIFGGLDSLGVFTVAWLLAFLTMLQFYRQRHPN